jgi:hypothetical protein
VQQEGFVVRFTRCDDAAQATHPQPTSTAAEVAPHAMSVRRRVGFSQRHVRKFHLPNFTSHDSDARRHDRAYYTLNEIPH